MSRVVRRAIIGLAFVGFASAAASTYVHYQLVQDPAYTSFCDISERVSFRSVPRSTSVASGRSAAFRLRCWVPSGSGWSCC